MSAALSPYASDGSLRFGFTFLADHFRSFHGLLLQFRREADLGSGNFALTEGLGGTDPAMTMCQKLAQLLEYYQIEAQRLGGAVGLRLCREAVFVMAALADEILLHGPSWVGQQRWRATLLESRMFSTYDSGERFFAKLDQLLRERDPLEAPLATIYLMALKLDFQGKFRGADSVKSLDQYRVALFEFIVNRAPAGEKSTRLITPDAYDHVIAIHKPPLLPDVWGWSLALAGFILVFLLVSHFTWLSLMRPVLAVLQSS